MFKKPFHITLKLVWPNFLPIGPTSGPDPGEYCFVNKCNAMI